MPLKGIRITPLSQSSPLVFLTSRTEEQTLINTADVTRLLVTSSDFGYLGKIFRFSATVAYVAKSHRYLLLYPLAPVRRRKNATFVYRHRTGQRPRLLERLHTSETLYRRPFISFLSFSVLSPPEVAKIVTRSAFLYGCFYGCFCGCDQENTTVISPSKWPCAGLFERLAKAGMHYRTPFQRNVYGSLKRVAVAVSRISRELLSRRREDSKRAYDGFREELLPHSWFVTDFLPFDGSVETLQEYYSYMFTATVHETFTKNLGGLKRNFKPPRSEAYKS